MVGSERTTVALTFLLGLVGVPSLALVSLVLTFRAGAEEFSITFVGPLLFAMAVASLVVGTFRARETVVRVALLGNGIGLLAALAVGVLMLGLVEYG